MPKLSMISDTTLTTTIDLNEAESFEYPGDEGENWETTMYVCRVIFIGRIKVDVHLCRMEYGRLGPSRAGREMRPEDLPHWLREELVKHRQRDRILKSDAGDRISEFMIAGTWDEMEKG